LPALDGPQGTATVLIADDERAPRHLAATVLRQA